MLTEGKFQGRTVKKIKICKKISRLGPKHREFQPDLGEQKLCPLNVATQTVGQLTGSPKHFGFCMEIVITIQNQFEDMGNFW